MEPTVVVAVVVPTQQMGVEKYKVVKVVAGRAAGWEVVTVVAVTVVARAETAAVTAGRRPG